MFRQLIDWTKSRFFPTRYELGQLTIDKAWDGYFTNAEGEIDITWPKVIWPLIKDADFTNVLELAPGAGRNTAKLAELARTVDAVDLNEYALERCRERFKDYGGPCTVRIHKNDGVTLPMIADASISFVYCFDSAVHFGPTILRGYLHEFARVMRPGATGFLHHSDLGPDVSQNIWDNPHCRSALNGAMVRGWCAEVGLSVDQRPLPWHDEKASIVDCISLIRKQA